MLSINISELVLTILNFLLLWFLLNKFLFKPVIRFTEERQSRINAGLEAEKNTMERQQEEQRILEERADELSRELDQRRSAQRSESIARLEAQKDEIRRQGRDTRQQLREDIQRGADEAAAILEAERGELAGTLARRILE